MRATMRRFLLLIVLAALAALGIWYATRGSSGRATSTVASSLVPRETLAFVHLPDFRRARADWHETEFYKLWREPAVQEFLQQPLSSVPKQASARQKMQELDALEMKDAFFAITAWENNQPKMVGGFRFTGNAADVERVIGGWRARAQQAAPGATHETVNYQGHQIEVTAENTITIATVYDGNWFFAGNDVPALKLLLDRADRRLTDSATLAADENFTSATRHMPAGYTVMAYGRLSEYLQRLAASLPQEEMHRPQVERLRQVRSICAASAFQNGKIRDVLFVAMPKVEDVADLTRQSLPIATRNSFLYAATVLALNQLGMPATSARGAAAALPAMLQRFPAAFAANGITLEQWNSAFGTEIGLIGDWAENARLPALFATLPVTNAATARSIVAALTSSAQGDSTWTTSERDGVQYFSLPPANPMVPVTPTIAIGSQMLLVGLDAASVESGMKRGAAGTSELGNSPGFKTVEQLVPAAKQSFAYLDTAMLYARLDAALRPMLVMAAAFMPAITQTVDLGKLPPPDVITRHLSPIVMSQSYQGDGYLTESVGPISAYQTIIGIAAVSGAGAAFYQRQIGAGAIAAPGGITPSNPAATAASPSGAEDESSPRASPTPEETP